MHAYAYAHTRRRHLNSPLHRSLAPALFLRSRKPIKAGQELTISYIDNLTDDAEQRAQEWQEQHAAASASAPAAKGTGAGGGAEDDDQDEDDEEEEEGEGKKGEGAAAGAGAGGKIGGGGGGRYAAYADLRAALKDQYGWDCLCGVCSSVAARKNKNKKKKKNKRK